MVLFVPVREEINETISEFISVFNPGYSFVMVIFISALGAVFLAAFIFYAILTFNFSKIIEGSS